MQELIKVVQRQDAFYKLSPSSSNETSINLSTEISSLISDESGEVTFTIYKDDLIKAISALCLIPKVYRKKNQEPSKPFEIMTDLFKLIEVEFGDFVTAEYTVYHFKRNDGRSYFNNLKLPNGFNFRSFLVEQFSLIHFKKSDEGKLSMRLETRLPEESIERIEEKPSFDELDESLPLQVIYYGAPGTGKSHKVDTTAKEDNSVRTTFHPDSDYASFVGAYKPTMQQQRIHYVDSKGQIAYVEQDKTVKDELKHPGTENKIVYKYVPQAFLKAYVEAWKRIATGAPYFLVIEEINRGNCAQIFGDLFQLLDRNDQEASSYAITADEDITQFLAKDSKGFAGFSANEKEAIRNFVLIKDSGERVALGDDILLGKKLLLPPNLRIWATMNTSDQSLFPIDSAFKRRWNWEYMPIEYDKKNWLIAVGDRLYFWGKFLELINPEILELTGSADKQMGYFFAKADTNDKSGNRNIISQKLFINKVLFYLWTDVLKDYDLSKKPFVYEDENRKKHAFRFTDFFGDFATENLIRFFDGIEGLTVAGTDEPNDENDKEFSVTFLDGTIINADTLTDTYAQALQKIGFEQVAQFSSEKQYKNPLVTREKIEGLERPRRYKELDGWYILVGPDTYPYYTKLEMLNKELNLNLIIKHK